MYLRDRCAGRVHAGRRRTDFVPVSFDPIFSQFGTMVYDNSVAAFRHLRRRLSPGGQLAVVYWRGATENDWIRTPMMAIRDIVPLSTEANPEAPGHFSLGDRTRVGRILTAAGHDGIGFEAVDHAVQVGPLGRALAG